MSNFRATGGTDPSRVQPPQSLAQRPTVVLQNGTTYVETGFTGSSNATPAEQSKTVVLVGGDVGRVSMTVTNLGQYACRLGDPNAMADGVFPGVVLYPGETWKGNVNAGLAARLDFVDVPGQGVGSQYSGKLYGRTKLRWIAEAVT